MFGTRPHLRRAKINVPIGLIVHDGDDHRNPFARGGVKLHPVHQHATVAGRDHKRSLRPGELGADTQRNRAAHRPQIGQGEMRSRFPNIPILREPGPVRTRIDAKHPIIREGRAQFRDDARRMHRDRIALHVLAVEATWPRRANFFHEGPSAGAPRFQARGLIDAGEPLQGHRRVADHRHIACPSPTDDQRIALDVNERF